MAPQSNIVQSLCLLDCCEPGASNSELVGLDIYSGGAVAPDPLEQSPRTGRITIVNLCPDGLYQIPVLDLFPALRFPAFGHPASVPLGDAVQ